jgi:phosphoribosylglycinamide formyltransferase 2
MQFSSPLKTNSTKVMLLGSGELGKEVIISLQRLGMEVIAVDRYENAPGHQVAHRAYTIDMTDADALEQLIQKEKPALVVPEIEAINTKLLEKLEAENVTKVIPNVRAVQLTMNREGIRKLAAEELKIPTSPYALPEVAMS